MDNCVKTWQGVVLGCRRLCERRFSQPAVLPTLKGSPFNFHPYGLLPPPGMSPTIQYAPWRVRVETCIVRSENEVGSVTPC